MSTAPLTLPRLVARPIAGDTTGTCYVCGSTTEHGHRKTMAVNQALLYAGDVVCPLCLPLVTDRAFRSTSWLATATDITHGKLRDIGQAILAPPAPPFFIYLTKGGHRIGWLSMLNRVSTSQETFFVSCDFIQNPVLVRRPQAQELHALLAELREEKVTKAELRTGVYYGATYERAIKGRWLNGLRMAQALAHNPVWEVLTYVVA